MIDFQDVTYTYPNTAHPALEKVSFHVDPGKLVLVTGPSGSGKSTLLRCINGLAPHFSGGTMSGSLRVAGLDPVAASPQIMSSLVGFVFQDPETQFVVDRVEDEIAFGLENSGAPRDEIARRVDESIGLVGLTGLRKRRIEAMSGGEKQRVALATALALHPKILVLDEPTSQLDPESAEDVLLALENLKKKLGITILISEHRLERMLPFTDQMLHIEKGRLAAAGNPRSVVAKISLDPPLVALGKKMGWSSLPLTVEEARETASREGCITCLPAASLPLPDSAAREASSVWIHAEGIQASPNHKPVLQDVDLDVPLGKITVLIGRNGAGKTTLLRCLVGLLKPSKGSITLSGADISPLSVAEICRKVAYLPQDPNAMLFADHVEDELWITLRNHGIDQPHIPPLVLLDKLGLAMKAKSYPRDLSTGERQRVALGAVTVTLPRGILLDEPTRGLDYQAKTHLADLLRAWRDEGLAILLVTHDVELAAQLADRVYLMENGRITANGTPAQVLGATPHFMTQVAQVFPGAGWLTAADVGLNRN